eukprot:2826702-Pyramimonas_sp.AAC.2
MKALVYKEEQERLAKNRNMISMSLEEVGTCSRRMLDGYSAPQSYIPIEGLRLDGGCGIFLLRGYDWPVYADQTQQ